MKKSIHSREHGVFLRLLMSDRKRSGVTQVALASALGLTQSHVSKIERGEVRLDILQLRAVCTALGTTLADFVLRLERELKALK